MPNRIQDAWASAGTTVALVEATSRQGPGRARKDLLKHAKEDKPGAQCNDEQAGSGVPPRRPRGGDPPIGVVVLFEQIDTLHVKTLNEIKKLREAAGCSAS